jgi:phenylalanyl-tRNA synthetase alpha chain
MTAAPWTAALAEIAAAPDDATLAQLELHLLGRKQGVLTQALKDLNQLPPEEKRTAGAALNAAKEEITQALAMRRAALQGASLSQLGTADRLDVALPLPSTTRGHLHPIPEFIREVETTFTQLGFDVADGPELELDDYNFTLLNFHADHPARDAHDTFWLDPEGKRVLRTHTSGVQVRYMQSHTPPFRMVCPGRVYRKDADATHSPMFHQFEGLMIDRDVSLATMKQVMTHCIEQLVKRPVNMRFRTAYFPFVEPGLEVDLQFPGEDRWLEVVGCGMVHPNVLRNGGIDPEQWQGFAFGFGVERLLMIRHGIKDLRGFYEGDPAFLAQF